MCTSIGSRGIWTAVMVLWLTSVAWADVVLAKMKGNTVKGLYSAIIQIEPKKGYILVTNNSNVVWVEASKAAKPHIWKLPVGEMIDIVVEMRGNKKPPLMKSWKLVSGESDCKSFDGRRCR